MFGINENWMQHFSLVRCLLTALLLAGASLFAQTPCYTHEAAEALRAQHPGLDRQLAEAERQAQQAAGAATRQRVTIPVVFHVLYHSPQENLSDAQLRSQLDALNEDFALLADTSRVRGVFKTAVADASIQFCLATRDPNGQPTTGINRAYTPREMWYCCDSMKNSAYGGIDPWPNEQYLNIWVCRLSFANGYAYYPGTPAPYDGVVLHYYVTGRTGYVAPGYLGRTGTHEVGHWLGLYHPFDYNQCVGTNPADCSSAGDRICDTPPMNTPSYSCDISKNTCTDSPDDLPDQFENYMDYAPDACRVMFSREQVARMRGFLFSRRLSLLSSLGCVSPGSGQLNAALSRIAEPFDIVCQGMVFPRVQIANQSDVTLTSLDIHYRIDGQTPQTYNWSGQLAPGRSEWVTLPGTQPQPGRRLLTCYSSGPNASTDVNPLNDTLRRHFEVFAGQGANLPLIEDFEAGAFPPPGWYRSNPDLDRPWERSADAGGFGLSQGAAWFNNFYNGAIRTLDGLWTPNLNFSRAGAPYIAFDLAYALPRSTFYSDTLRIEASADCGQNWFQLYKKGGAALATAPVPVQFLPFIPTPQEWRRDSVPLPVLRGQSRIMLRFVNKSGWSNDLFLDNIQVDDALAVPIEEAGAGLSFSNPFRETLQLLLDAPAPRPMRIELCDLQGRVLLNNQIQAGQQILRLPAAGIAAGLYSLRLYNGQQLQVFKAVKLGD